MEKTYQVLARKYRPRTFEELIGQDVLVKTLVNALDRKKVHHAFMLTGIRGVGKTTTARIIAKSLNCIGLDGKGSETSKPCLQCSHCVAIAAGLDQDVIEFDAASHTGVNDIRDIIDSIGYAPVASRYKIYIIDEVHMLSNSAFNALLKTLEEPPSHVKFIFATTEIRKVPITILSRCIRFDLPRVSEQLLTDYLQDIAKREGYNLDPNAASLLAYSSEGSVRDSLSLLDRVISYNNFSAEIGENAVADMLGISDGKKVYDIYGFLLESNLQGALEQFNEFYRSMTSPRVFLEDMLTITHRLLMKKTGNAVENISSQQNKWFEDHTKKVSMAALFRIWQFLIRAMADMENTSNYKAFMQVLLIKICYGMNMPEVSDMLKKLQNNSTTLNSKKDDLAAKVLGTFSGSKIV